MLSSRLCLSLVLLLIGAAAAAAPQADASKPTSEPPGAPVEMTVRSKADSYDLDAGGDPSFKFQEKIRAGQKNGLLPRASRVDLELQIKNVTNLPVQVLVSGDGTEFDLDLKGSGAISVATGNKRMGFASATKAVTIKPGKTHVVELTELSYGPRNREKRAYITETGLYELTVGLRTGVSPAPKGSKQRANGFGEVLLKAPPVKLRVVRPS